MQRKLGSVDAKDTIIKSSRHPSRRILNCVPLTGLVRAEWAIARYGQVIPCNWSQTDYLVWMGQFSPLNWAVADARNLAVHQCMELGFEWLHFIDHDVILPHNTIVTWNQRILLDELPIWSGLYFTKSVPSEPLIYRGRGNGYFTDWKLGDLVWVDGIPMGCTMIHSSILKIMYQDAPEYTATDINGNSFKVKRVFETPTRIGIDPETRSWQVQTGTEDLDFCNRIVEENVLKRAGWDEIAEKEFPFLIDTNIFCRHIDFDGVQYPSRGEEQYFVSKAD